MTSVLKNSVAVGTDSYSESISNAVFNSGLLFTPSDVISTSSSYSCINNRLLAEQKWYNNEVTLLLQFKSYVNKANGLIMKSNVPILSLTTMPEMGSLTSYANFIFDWQLSPVNKTFDSFAGDILSFMPKIDGFVEYHGKSAQSNDDGTVAWAPLLIPRSEFAFIDVISECFGLNLWSLVHRQNCAGEMNLYFKDNKRNLNLSMTKEYVTLIVKLDHDFFNSWSLLTVETDPDDYKYKLLKNIEKWYYAMRVFK